MNIIKKTSNQNGSYPPIQTWSQAVLPEGYAMISKDLDTSVFYEHNGFVNLEVENNVVVGMTANVEAWEAWKSSLPVAQQQVTQTQEERIASLEAQLAALMKQISNN